jgi:DNA-binding transcriptional MocR family regulator
VDTYRWELFNALDAKGMDELRHTLVSHLAADQVFAKKEQIIISPGIQHMLEFLAKLPFPNGKSTILVEQPSFDMYLRFLEAEGIPVCGVARTSEGIDLQKLEEKFKSGGIKFFYTMPRHHNPLGIEYSTEEKKKIAQLATKYDVYIVEDDYMVDVGESKFDSIYYYNETAHVIYIKSFSKIIFPGLKVGAAVFPENMLKIYSKYQSHSITSPLPQAALQLYIKNGMYERHKQKIIDQYAARIRALNEAIRRYNDDNLITIPDVQSGIFVPFQLPQTVNLERLVERLKAKQIMVVPGKQFYLTNYKNRAKFLRVSVSRALVEQMDTGVREIIEEVRREVKSPI